MATVPLLTRCLDAASLAVLPARRLQQPGKSPETDAMLEGAARGDYPLYVLFPGPGAKDLAEVANSEPHGARLQAAAARRPADGPGQADPVAAEPAGVPGTLAAAGASAAASAAASADASAGAGAADGGPEAPAHPAYVLVVVDGTWRQAKEMFKHVAGRCLPPGGPGVQVSLKPSDVLPAAPPPPPHAVEPGADAPPPAASAAQAMAAAGAQGLGWGLEQNGAAGVGADAAAAAVGAADEQLQYDPNMPCLIRKEPVEGFVTTYEATARALGLLERSPHLADSLLAPLRLMTRLQAAFDPAIRSRMLQLPEPPKPQQGKAAGGAAPAERR
ncbi:hypothetical protein CHLRE_16g673169v5 [Chlamydomonas reinhardtii]|uniref:tRNA-uridine aminocarboxypropyltransferase n=1 Tax=Chlamydomonas reinhardtii TaxID=3055 RepID=A8J3C8_CHLRE|nr:uncharacterized protein CHLRE_16g673169v5 [Chlamydomonas reinhardtii]PNW72370.1 hypothetical protein CHLRE_16g673169v5 [Chlamydomonas reinhardtii]|eukprot:XP_001695792.1 predicted protein [Chlamydomonas reinhardtii]